MAVVIRYIGLGSNFPFKLFDSSLNFVSKVEVFFLNFFAFIHFDNKYIITLHLKTGNIDSAHPVGLGWE